ncbi:MAG: VIT1/CCC1 transporter family protein [Chlamydiota bacterium]
MPTPHSPANHFEGKSIPAHLKEARIKGARAAAEIHGTEISGQKSAFADTLKDTALTVTLLWLLLSPLLPTKQTLLVLVLFFSGWIFWKTARSACFGWARLERLHRVIEEERWEIEHHREQEREELFELYRAKGFEGELLSEVVNVLMADDNRLLEIMLEEELGIPLEVYEHPLQQASGAFLGAFAALLIGSIAYLAFSSTGLISALFLLFLLAGVFTAKVEKITIIPSLVWNAAIFCLSGGLIYFLQKIVTS